VGLTNLTYGCQQLEHLEIRNYPFGEASFTIAVVAINCLKYLFVQSHHQVNETGVQLLALSHPCLLIKMYPVP